MIGDADAIAVVGIAARAPGAATYGELWRNILAGRECFTELEPAADPSYVPVKGVLDGADEFDAEFFGFTPREALITDPQQRIFLQLAWHAFEDAGHTPESCGRVGVFASATHSRYLSLLERHEPDLHETTGDLQLRIATESDFLATRAAYKLNLRGPAVNVQTACSSSLVAVHLACSALLAGDCDSALAGGVTITSPLRSGYRYQPGSILSPDGHCRAFDARAEGTVPGNGGGVVLLRRFEDAAAAGDDIYALILGSSINNDGSDKIGFTAPSAEGQESAIRAALAVAGVQPAQVGLIEAHGTGTPLGDPIEVGALRRVFAGSPSWCGLGSVKSNIGHLDAAAGILGLIKAVCAVHEGVVPPTAGFAAPNPELELEQTPFRVVDEAVPWRDDQPRIAGVSAFGVGGTNAHVVCAQAPTPTRPEDNRTPVVAGISASTPEAVAELRDAVVTCLGELNASDVAYTLARGRVAHRFRLAGSGDNNASLAQALLAAVPVAASSDRPALLFPGQGSRWRTMGRALTSHQSYAGVVERARDVLAGDVELWLDQAPDELETRTDVVQVALFVHQMGVVELLAEAGVEPVAVLGHSVGEFAAACTAGVLEFEEALRLVAIRGRAMRELCEPGGMVAVGFDAERARSWVDDAIELAAINAPERCVLGGPLEAVDDLERRLADAGVPYRRLDVDRAFHTAAVEPAVVALAEAASKLPTRQPRIAFVSASDGQALPAVEPELWARQARACVRYADSAVAVAALTPLAVDVGPGQTMASLAPSTLETITVWPRRNGSEEPALASAIGSLWCHGAARLDGGSGRRTHLPGYPFARERHWPGADATVEPEPETTPEAPAAEGDWIAAAFEEVLGRRPTEDESFFDLGGDSLAAVQLLSRIAAIAGEEPDLEAFFDEPTVAGLTRQLTAVAT